MNIHKFSVLESQLIANIKIAHYAIAVMNFNLDYFSNKPDKIKALPESFFDELKATSTNLISFIKKLEKFKNKS